MMKKLLLITMAMSISIWAIGQVPNAWMNEIHYDNSGGDVGEFFEIVLENPGNWDLGDLWFHMYNGSNGETYGDGVVANYTVGDTEGDFTFYIIDYTGIQNGSPDGMCLSYFDGSDYLVIQFYSWEGEFTATDGPAAGLLSLDIGVSEDGGTQIGESLQLTGTGEIYDDFTWLDPAAETPGSLNNNQTLGTFVPDPEPTNYPADFTATVNVNSIDVTWTNDDTGPQLPSGYLVMAKYEYMPDFTLPVDGVPVEDDYDFGDGYYYNNMPASAEIILFMFLNTNQGYDFAIFPYTNSGEFIDYKTDGTYPTAFGLTENVDFTFEEYFNEIPDRSGMTYYSVIGDDQSWYEIDWNGNPPGAMRMNGYQGGVGTVDNEDWAITQQITATEYSNLHIRFDQYTNYGDPPNGLSLWVSTDYTGGDPSVDGTWEEITDRIEFPTSNSTYTTSGSADVSDFNTATTYFAFKYESNGSIPAVDWRVDNIQVYSYIPIIDITYPDGGETVYQGQQIDITWDHDFWVEETVALYLQQGEDNRDLTLITESTPVEDGSYTWSVWSSIEPGDDFKIMVTGPEGPQDFSDDYFSIVAEDIARVQVIHNSADLAAEVVDVWLDDVLLLDDFTFRTASPFVDAPAGEEFTIAIKGPDSTDPNDPIWSQDYTLAVGETYVLIANGIVSAEGYDPVKPFDIYVYPTGREMATDMNNTDLLVFHGSTDAPTVDVVEIGQGAGTIIDDFMYEDFAGYLELPTADYVLDIRDETGMNSVVTYAAPLETLGLDGAALVTVASGFLNPDNNSGGPAFGLWVALPTGGELIELPVYETELPAPVNLEGEVSMNYLDVLLTWEPPGTTGGDTVELVYDNDVTTGAYYWPDAAMATHMSPTADCQVLALKFWTSGTSGFNAEVYEWTGSEPGSMVFTVPATGVDQDWLEIDVSAEGIMFTTDFVVGFGSLDDQVSLGFDADLDNGRSWDWDGSAWAAWNEAYLIRAIVLYPDGRTAEIGAGMSDGQMTIAPDFEIAEHSKDYSQVVTVEPIDSRNSRDAELLGYNVYRDDAMINTELVTETTYTDVEPDLGSHDYYVTAVYEIFGESDPSNVVTIVITDVNEITSTSVNVYPNPSNGTFTISLPEGAETIVSVMDLTGKSVYQSNASGTTTIKLDDMYKGIYLLNIYDAANNTNVVKKLVIN